MNKNGTFGTWLTWKSDQYKDDLGMSSYLVRNECALREGWQACAESKKSETNSLQIENALYSSDAKRCWEMMPELENDDADYELHEAVQIKIAELDKANARIAQLEDALKWAKYTCSDLAHATSKVVIALEQSSDTWLLEHDKAVEVRVLEEVAANVFISTTSRGDIELEQMIESRK